MRGSLRFFVVGAVVVFAGSVTNLTAQETAPDTVLLTGSSLGGVKFSHTSHQGFSECTLCHHESRPAMPLTTPQQPCTACHTKTATAPMTTNIRDAFHNATGKAGVCVDCHVTEAAAGKVVPIKCAECHKKANS